jgi:prepilin-type N-terminal cleavage/methylation domain-containing protein
MTVHSNEKGFTFTELMIAVTIMALGFLAMAQMQFLSLRQKQLAEEGTIATNIIQFIADRDMEEIKRTHLLNSIAFMEAQSGRLNPGSDSEPHLQYCKGEQNVCEECPCNPLETITSDLSNDGADCTGPETACSVIDVHNFNPEDVEFSTNEEDCASPAGDSLVALRRVCVLVVDDPSPSVPTTTTLNVTYGVKSKIQFDESDFDNLSIKDTLATQSMAFSAHEDDWSQFINGWTDVIIPHVP